MRKKLQKMLLTIIVMGAAQLSFAQQNYVHQVIILNEGQYDYFNQVQVTPVSIGAYDPVSKNYAYFDAINEMRWSSDVVVDDNNIYVAGDSLLLVYDKNTYQLQNSLTIQGIRKITLWNNSILITRGNAVKLNSYFQVYDKTTLNFIYELDTLVGPEFSAEGIVVLNDTAYIAVSNSFEWGNYKGLLGIIDLNNQTYTAEIDLGSDGVNPDNVMVYGNMIYTLNNKDWTGSSITEFNTNDRTFQTVNISAPSGCGASVFAFPYIYYQSYKADFTTPLNITRFDVNVLATMDTITEIPNTYGMITDDINNLIYITSTDFVSYGMAYIMQFDGTVIDSFSVCVSPGNMALDVRQITTGVEDVIEPLAVSIYPNPGTGYFTLDLTPELGKLSYVNIYSIDGSLILNKVVNGNDLTSFEIDLTHAEKGIYFLQAVTVDKVITGKLVVQ